MISSWHIINNLLYVKKVQIAYVRTRYSYLKMFVADMKCKELA